MGAFIFVGLRNSPLIKKIDMKSTEIMKTLTDTVDDIESLEVSGTTIAPDSELQSMFPFAFPGCDPALVITPLLEACVELMKNLSTCCEGQVSFDVVTLYIKYVALVRSGGYSSAELSRIFFWCFLLPFFNLDSIYVMRRTNMRPPQTNKFVLCFLVIRATVLGEGLKEMLPSISNTDRTLLADIREQFRLLSEYFRTTHEQELSDTIMHYGLTADEGRATLLLAREFSSHLDVISEELLADTATHTDLLYQFAPFIRAGLR